MEILQEDNGSKGRFYIKEEGEELAEMTYVWSGEDKFIIDHTYVNERLKGQNVGLKLVSAAVHMARERGLKIIPLCPFAKATMEKRPEMHDVLQGK
jgi:predicted GNAT family acetyltransferase